MQKAKNSSTKMKTLILIRHATAESENFLKKDFERTLEPIGRKEAEKVGEFIKSKGLNVEKIICSSAFRTKETACLASGTMGFNPERVIEKLELYNAGFQKIVEEIKKTEESISTLVLVAHNPGISQASTALAVTGNFQLAPSAAVSLKFNIKNWSELTPATGSENWYYIP